MRWKFASEMELGATGGINEIPGGAVTSGPSVLPAAGVPGGDAFVVARAAAAVVEGMGLPITNSSGEGGDDGGDEDARAGMA